MKVRFSYTITTCREMVMVDCEKVTHVCCHVQNNYGKNCSSNPKKGGKKERERNRNIRTGRNN